MPCAIATGRLGRICLSVLLLAVTLAELSHGAITGCTDGTVLEGAWCICEADKTLTSAYPDANGALSCSASAFASCPPALPASYTDVADNVTITDVSINDQGDMMVISLEQPRVTGRQITGISLGTCTFSADNAGRSYGTGQFWMRPANLSTCMQQFYAEFSWIKCMENAQSMNRTVSEDGTLYYYSGAMVINITTPLTVNEFLQANQTQTLARALKFAVPKTVTVDMTQSSVTIWNQLLTLPNITYLSTTWGRTATASTTMRLTSSIIAPWTMNNQPAVIPEVTLNALGDTDPIAGAIQLNTVCNNDYVRGSECNQTISLTVQHNGRCDLSGMYSFQNVPMTCQEKSLADCPAGFLTNWVLEFNSPMLCAETTSSFTTSTGEEVPITIASESGDELESNLGLATSVTLSASLPANAGKYFTGLSEVVRFLPSCRGQPYLKAMQYVSNIVVSADGLSAKFDLALNNVVRCNATAYTALQISPTWTLTTTPPQSSRRSEPERRQTITVTTSQQFSVGSGGPGAPEITGQSNTPLEYSVAITNIVARTGNTSRTDIGLTAQILGPYMFDTESGYTPALSTNFAPMPLPGYVTVAGECTGNQTCLQTLSFTIEHSGACQLDGNYTLLQFPVICQPDLPNGVDCANTTTSFTIELQGINVCNVSTLTVDDIWLVEMDGQNGRKAMVYGDNFPIAVTISKLKDMGQDIEQLQVTKVERRVPASANSACSTPADVTAKAQLVHTPPALTATLNMLMDEATVCEPPQRGSRTQVELTFTYTFTITWNTSGRRRRRHMSARQAAAMGSSNPSPVAEIFDVMASQDELAVEDAAASAAYTTAPSVVAMVCALLLGLALS